MFVLVVWLWWGVEMFVMKDGFFDSLESWWGVAASTSWTGLLMLMMVCELEEEEFYDYVELK